MKHTTKRKYNIPEPCKLTGKIPLSEAQCIRKLEKYSDIVRYYKCSDPNCGYHLTHLETSKVLAEKNLNPKERNRLLNIRIQELEREVEKLTIQLNEYQQSNP